MRPGGRVQESGQRGPAQLRRPGRGGLAPDPDPVPPGPGAAFGDVGPAVGRADDPGRDRLAAAYQRRHHRVLGAAGDEVGGPVQRVDQPGRRGQPQGVEQPGVGGRGLLADHRRVHHLPQPTADQLLGLAVGHGHQLARRLLADLALGQRAEARHDRRLGGLAQDPGHGLDPHGHHATAGARPARAGPPARRRWPGGRRARHGGRTSSWWLPDSCPSSSTAPNSTSGSSAAVNRAAPPPLPSSRETSRASTTAVVAGAGAPSSRTAANPVRTGARRRRDSAAAPVVDGARQAGLPSACRAGCSVAGERFHSIYRPGATRCRTAVTDTG